MKKQCKNSKQKKDRRGNTLADRVEFVGMIYLQRPLVIIGELLERLIEALQKEDRENQHQNSRLDRGR